MKSTEIEMKSSCKQIMKKVFKSLFYTFITFILSAFGISLLMQLMTVEQSNTSSIVSVCIGIIFTLFYCTLTIIDEIRRTK